MSILYSAYGLVFESSIEVPELTRSGQAGLPTDVRISQAPVPEHLADPSGRGVLFEASANEFLLRMPDVASFLVRNGSEIIIEPAPQSIPSEVRVFLLGSAIGALLHQRQSLVLHASAFGTQHGAVLFAGASGAGKSTLLGKFLERGHAMMVDDVCAVDHDSAGGLQVLPGYPRTRLWADAAQKLNIETASLQRTRQSLEKYERQLPDLFWQTPLPIRKLYVLNTHNDDTIEIRDQPAVQRFSIILHNTYRRTFLAGLAMEKPHFELASQLAASIPVAVVARPAAGFKLNELADAIEADLGMSPT